MSAKTDDALQNIQNIIAKGMPHKDEMFAVQGYCDMLTKEIAELESDIETLHTDLNTIVPQQDKEIEKLNHDLDAEHHRACIYEESAKAWKATATRAAEYCMAAGVVCDFCPYDSNNCIGIPCPVVDEQVILAHFGAPEEEK